VRTSQGGEAITVPTVTTQSPAPSLASANRRIVARYLDAMVLGGFAVACLWLIAGETVSGQLANSHELTVLVMLAMMLLDGPCTKRWGGTPGKMLLALRVVATDGAR
jgi:uncharacterized RDD family membrane protein YckC